MENTNVAVMTMKSERADAIANRLYEMGMSERVNATERALLITELNEGKGYLNFGYDDIKSYLKDVWNISDTQRKVSAIVAHNFATRNEDGSYTYVDDRLKSYGMEQLNLIQKFENFDKENPFALIDALGIDETTTRSDLQAMYNKSKGIEDKQAKEETKDEKKTVSEDTEETKLKVENDHLNAKVENSKSEIAKLYQLALDKKINDADFRKQAIEILARVEKIYK